MNSTPITILASRSGCEMHLRLATSLCLNSHPGERVNATRCPRSPKILPTRRCSWKLAILDRLESQLARRTSANPPPLQAIRVASLRQPPNICSRPISSSGHRDRLRRSQSLDSPDLSPKSSRRKHMLARRGGESLNRHLQQPSPMLISSSLPSPPHSHRTETPHLRPNLRPDRRQPVQLLSQCGLRLRPGPYRPYLQRLCNQLTAIARKLQMRTSGATMQLHTKVSLLPSTCFLTSTRSLSSFAVTER